MYAGIGSQSFKKKAHRVVHFVFKAATSTSQILLFNTKIKSDRIDYARYDSDS
jgi:hypothetical protein